MKRGKKLIILLIVLITANFSLEAQEQEEINMLFIGNSFTARHDLSELVKKVVEEGKPYLTVNVEKLTYGGQSLFQHTEYYFSQTFIEQNTIADSVIEARIKKMEVLLELDEVPEEFIHFWRDIREQAVQDFPKDNISRAIQRHNDLLNNNPKTKWDYIVLQSWQDEIQDLNDGYAKYARYLKHIAAEQGAEVILYITAPDVQNQSPVSGPLKQENVDQELGLIVELAREIEPYSVVHVPMAINRIQKGGTDLTFRYVNDFHPNQRTAFLTSNMFYAAIFNECTDGFDYNTVTETKTHFTDEDPNVKLDPDDGPATVVLDGEEKTYLQKMACNAVTEFVNLWKGEVAVTGISIKNAPAKEIYLGKNYQLYTEIQPMYASDKNVVWDVSSGNAVTVDENGLLSAVEEGNAIVKVTTIDGGFSDSCEVNVIIEIKPVYGVSMGGCPGYILETEDTLRFVANVVPEDADDPSVVWTSSNPSVAVVDEHGLVKAISEGVARIMVKTNDGGYTAECNIGIRFSGVAVNGVEIAGCPAKTIPVDSTFQLLAIVSPSNADDSGVSWSSSDETVATIDENGQITPHTIGSVSITVSTNEGSFIDECAIMVDVKNGAIKIECNLKKILLYPNPVTDKLYVKFTEKDKNREIMIYNNTGQLILKESAGDLHKLIDINDLKVCGLMAVQIKSGRHFSVHKVCVL